jgi:hypothetical protein
MSDQERASASKGAFKAARITVCPMFGEPYELDVSHGEGGHGGADPVMLAQLFAPAAPADPYGRAASHIDGAASLLVGFAANESMRSGALVRTRDLFSLPAPAGLS